MLALVVLVITAAVGPVFAQEGEGGFHGTYVGTVGVFEVENAVASALLPEHLELVEEGLTDEDHHPMAVLLNTETAAPPAPLVPGNSYDSIIPIVLSTRLVGGIDCSGPTEMSFISISYMNSAPAVAAGQTLFGLNSHLMELEQTPTSWTATSLDVLAPFTLSAAFDDAPLTKKGRKNWSRITKLLSQPMAGVALDGVLTWHSIDWKFAEATVGSRAIALASSWPLEPIATLDLAIPGVNSSALGGFSVASGFDSALPTRCSQ